MRKKLIDIIIDNLLSTVNNIGGFDLIGIERGEKEVLDDNKNPTGEVRLFSRINVEIPHKNGALSRSRLEVKVYEDTPQITEAQIEEGDYSISFTNLTCTFIDNRKNMYFSADSYTIHSNEEGYPFE